MDETAFYNMHLLLLYVFLSTSTFAQVSLTASTSTSTTLNVTRPTNDTTADYNVSDSTTSSSTQSQLSSASSTVTVSSSGRPVPAVEAVKSALSVETIALIAGVGGGGLLIIVIAFIIVIILLIRRRGSPSHNNTSKQPDENDNTRSANFSETVQDGDIHVGIVTTSQPVELGTLPSEKPTTRIKVTDLAAYVDRMTETDGFASEFKQLPPESISDCTAGKLPENFRQKNRFVNVLPYDETRVKLPVSDDEAADADYINANYITKYGEDERDQAAYIATQGPRDKTITDFWKMIWYEQINRVLMLTMLVEGGKKKCEMYWPENTDTPVQYGDVTVSLVEVQRFGDYIQRTMNVRHSDEKERRVIQLQFLLWRDKGAPDDMYPLLAFMRKVQTLDAVASGPLLVHCSAGVGRTGTFMALTMLLCQAKQSGEVDIFGVVTHLRRQRMMLVQILVQYTYIYRCLLDAVTTGETAIAKSALGNSYAKMTEEISRQFDLLDRLKSENIVDPDAEGLQPLNVGKNRRLDVVPADYVRVHLSYPSVYINAAIVTGFHTPLSYVLTQLPLRETVDDFWRLVVEERCHSVVLLDAIDSDDTTVEFWPSTVDECTSYGGSDVTLMTSRSVGSLVVHSLRLTTARSDNAQSVDVMELRTWPSGHETPADCESFLELIHTVTQRQHQLQSTPAPETPRDRRGTVIVQCLDGASRCGLYTAASYMLDKLQHHNEVDVLLSCRYIIAARPTAITSLEQYDYLYRLAVAAAEWTPPSGAEQTSSIMTSNYNNDSDTRVMHSAQVHVVDDDDKQCDSYDERL